MFSARAGCLCPPSSRASASNGVRIGLQEKIAVADEVLVAKAVEKINDGDVVATYASSSVVQAVLVSAHQVRALPGSEYSSAVDRRCRTSALHGRYACASRAVKQAGPRAHAANETCTVDGTVRAGPVRRFEGPSCAAYMLTRAERDRPWTTFTLPSRQMGKRFRVVVLDARPHNEGRALLRALLEAGLCASYCLLNAAAYIISEVTKVRAPASLFADLAVVHCAPRSRPDMH